MSELFNFELEHHEHRHVLCPVESDTPSCWTMLAHGVCVYVYRHTRTHACTHTHTQAHYKDLSIIFFREDFK
jgi:hypothetical protein